MSCGVSIVCAQTTTPALPSPLLEQSTPTPAPTPTPIPMITNVTTPQLFKNQLVPPFTITATPQSPSSGESVTVEAQIAASDPNTTNFIWTIDGVRRNDISGFGKKSFTFIAGEIGSSKRISVRAEPMDDSPVTTSQTIYTTDVALTWTAQTYIPKWYKGKALPIPNSSMRIAAIPTFIIDGSLIPANRLIFTWNIDGKRALQGVGQQVLEFKQPEQAWNTPTIVLTIEDLTKRIKKEIRTGIISTQPHVVIYQSLPLGGIEFRRGTSAFPSTAPGIIDIQAEPFFFNRQSKHDLSYAWSVQGTALSSTPQNPFFLTIDTQGQDLSDVPIRVTVQDSVSATDINLPLASTFLNIPIRK